MFQFWEYAVAGAGVGVFELAPVESQFRAPLFPKLKEKIQRNPHGDTNKARLPKSGRKLVSGLLP